MEAACFPPRSFRKPRPKEERLFLDPNVCSLLGLDLLGGGREPAAALFIVYEEKHRTEDKRKPKDSRFHFYIQAGKERKVKVELLHSTTRCQRRTKCRTCDGSCDFSETSRNHMDRLRSTFKRSREDTSE